MSLPLVLVDGSSYLYRAYHATLRQGLANSKGRPTGAVRTVISMLRALIKAYPGSEVAVIFDAKGKTFRNDIYPEYKAHRPPMPDDLREQIDPIHSIIKALGLPLIVIDGVEADDVIGTLCCRATERGMPVVVSTGDKDMAQLVNEHITLINTMTNTVMDIEGVQDKFGLPPELIIDFLALMGDSSDNIPGAPGVGEKTALALLQGIGSIDQIYQRLDDIAELGFRGAKKMSEKLVANKELVELSYELATIKTDVELDFKVEELKAQTADTEALRLLYAEMEFKTWLGELKQGTGTEESETSVTGAPAIAGEYETVLDPVSFEAWLKRLHNARLIAFDTETTSLDYMQAQVVGVSFAVEEGKAAYVPFAHDYPGAPDQLSADTVLGALKPLLENPQLAKVGQNLKYDASVLANHGITLQGIKYDTMLESYVLNSTAKHDMDNMSQTHLDHQTIKFEEVAGKGTKQLTFNQVDLELAGPYAAEDADITLRLHNVLWPDLSEQAELKTVFEDIELPLVNVLSTVERNGALVDANLLRAQSQALGEQMHHMQEKSYEIAGRPFNLSSPKQLGEILFDQLGLPVVKKTKTGAPSTAEEVLQELAEHYELPKVLLDYRSASKLKSTYTDRLPEMVNERTGRVHTSYHQAVTATGRLSSTSPNLQNIPIKSAEGRQIRQAFIAAPGNKIVAADYSQIELRIMAHLSGDESLLTAFSEGRDIHRATAAEVFGVAIDEVSSEQRRSAKAINFGLIYGMSAFGLAKQLQVGRGEAADYIKVYFDRYPGVKDYMDSTRERAAEMGYVKTLGGRRLYLPMINDKNGMRRQAAERTAINAPMQGTAADIIKKAMIQVDQWLKETHINGKMIMQVHDELVFEVAESDVEVLRKHVCELMSQAMSLSVPLVVEAGVGNNWDEAH